MRQRFHHLHLAASVIALAASSAWVSPALAQQTAAADPVEAVTVTGTSIRGTAPVGSSVTTVTQADIKATGATSVTGVLSSVPQLMGMGQVDGGSKSVRLAVGGASKSISIMELEEEFLK